MEGVVGLAELYLLNPKAAMFVVVSCTLLMSCFFLFKSFIELGKVLNRVSILETSVHANKQTYSDEIAKVSRELTECKNNITECKNNINDIKTSVSQISGTLETVVKFMKI